MEMSQVTMEMLNEAINNGIIDIDDVQRMYCRDQKTVVEHTKTAAGDRLVYLTDEALGIIAAAKQR